ncbi:adipokinetic hormone/corazonin-related peptide receptor variant I-like isoform X2 [Toxorhynchites rutilus septentrionalis]|uniref:adipokinetic hormone/corazonin-related peptide receptor variant I-like isoform X2 n=1 Tax=Toxorhynchites rutilus septentrionalis TaxID=329112 RepID=UPI00247A098E|nr:adipokinetic hormone/corazonin-related peptide receptor variant I-like isoform X2 [Toxorhynchites rutilus septentrionalis]
MDMSQHQWEELLLGPNHTSANPSEEQTAPVAAVRFISTAEVGNISLTNGQQLGNHTEPPIEPPGYTDSTVAVIIVYCVLFVVAASGNLSVVITLFRSRRHRRSRVSLMICHLAVADLMVAFIMIPLEVGWRITVQWHAGNVACKVFLFMRAFCLYLSSNVLVCVSLDRCFAVMYPLRVSAARTRGKIMLGGAWIIAFANAVPQSIIFRVLRHPQLPDFKQCVTFGFFRTPGLELAYNLFCVIAMYFVPLMIISAAYTFILCEISNRSREKETTDTSNSGGMRLRCNDLTHIERARQRTLRLTITIVAVFVWCWTPYVVMTLWYMFDRESAVKVDGAVQDGLFLMAVSNSCMNPLVYGSYAMKCRRPWRRQAAPNNGAQTVNAAQRRSTDAVSGPHSDRLTARDNKDGLVFEREHSIKLNQFGLTNGGLGQGHFGVGIAGGCSQMTATTRFGHCAAPSSRSEISTLITVYGRKWCHPSSQIESIQPSEGLPANLQRVGSAGRREFDDRMSPVVLLRSHPG